MFGFLSRLIPSSRRFVRASARVKLLPVCSWCTRVRTGKGRWVPADPLILARKMSSCTHGLCPDCASKYFPKGCDAA
jgi:hypothetical protein